MEAFQRHVLISRMCALRGLLQCIWTLGCVEHLRQHDGPAQRYGDGERIVQLTELCLRVQS